MSPKPGDSARYHNRSGTTTPGQPEAARVLFVHDDGYVNVEVFERNGKAHVLRRAYWHNGEGAPTLADNQKHVRPMDFVPGRGWQERSVSASTENEYAEPAT